MDRGLESNTLASSRWSPRATNAVAQTAATASVPYPRCQCSRANQYPRVPHPGAPTWSPSPTPPMRSP